MVNLLAYQRIIDMPRTRQFLAYFLVLIMSMSVFSDARAATYEVFTCKADGTVANPATGAFFPKDRIKTSCDNADTYKYSVFSSIVCNFVDIVNNTISKIYCGVQKGLLAFVGAGLALYIAVYGAQVLMGTARLEGGEIAIRLIKMAIVWLFVTQGSWGIGIVYNFFVGFTVESIDWVLSGPMQFCTAWDYTSANCIAGKGDNVSNIFNVIDAKIEFMVKDMFAGNGKIISFIIVLSFLLPPLFFMILSLIWMVVSIFAQSLISFLMAITAVAFLIALSPIFLCFMLFQSTKHVFDSWLKYIISYSIQPMIVFAIIALWINITSNFLNFVKEVSDIVTVYDQSEETGVVVNPVDTIGICDPKYTTDVQGPHIACLNNADLTSNNKLLSPSKIIKQQKFIYYLAYHLITLLVLCYAFLTILKNSASIARDIVGSQATIPLGAGFGGAGAGGLRSLLPGGGGGRGGAGKTRGGATQSIFGSNKSATSAPQKFVNNVRGKSALPNATAKTGGGAIGGFKGKSGEQVGIRKKP